MTKKLAPRALLGGALLFGALLGACESGDVVAYAEQEAGAGTSGVGGSAGTAGSGGSAANSGNSGSGGSGGAMACDPNCKCLDLSGHGYMVCRDLVSRQAAEARCAQYGMKLVRPDSMEENFLVRGAASNSELMSYWLGCDDLAQEGMVVWSSDGVPLDQTYSNFIDIDPADNEGQDCCVEYASASWHDEPCDSMQGVVCEQY